MPRYERFLDQVRRNSVALISLVVAVVSLTYNTWRNEQTEYNRNQRAAAFEVLLKLAELDEVVNYSQYGTGAEGPGDPKTGWALVNTIDVLASILAEPMPASGDRLVAAWSLHSDGLGSADEASVSAIRLEVDRLQDETVVLIQSLE